ncbi:site-specific integrase [Microbacterium sp. GXF6406]
MAYKLDQRWTDALDDFERAQTNVSGATTSRRIKHLRRFAATVDLSPWHVTATDVEAWLGALIVADSTRTTMRDSLRAFYRWATSAGRMREDPTAMQSHRASRLPVPEQWEQPLTAYERYLYAKGLFVAKGVVRV